ncbi:MAG: hypothetical protein OZSIB_3257 [Candidatus Ozemobacter sibiricus]|jgi:competence protein ComEA|uniref:Helix-hairpin-helix DNA-binding motif class 1 domain-containing protein n=1 Tax=Candidatus Ozemobacter sibiricus TaxID=2268124 RepID=A0A367ZT41_9BACT|nr:MAG: hypothetical protein OZSIB_3257 [Candidatus Ozemobacter sibiricus]
MSLTTLEKVTFTALLIGILLGLGLIVIQVRAHSARNRAVLADIAAIQALTPRTPLEKAQHSAEDDRENHNKLNINHATLQDLEMLPGMGKVMAQRILDFRQEKGEIKDLNELISLKGMTKKKYATLRRFLTAKGGRQGGLGAGKKLNLNFASFEELEKLPGVGKTLARSIIDVRNQRGGFHTLEDLQEVPGLTPAKLQKFVNLIEVP